MRRLPLRVLALGLAAAVVAMPPGSSAAVKPALTLARGGSVTTTGNLQTMDTGRNFTPATCSQASPSAANPTPNTGQCDVIPVTLKYPTTFAPDFKFSVTATLTYTQIGPPMSMQVCLFKRGEAEVYTCAGGGTSFDNPQVAVMQTDAGTRAIDVVVDQRVGYDNDYKLVLKWTDLNTPTKLSATSAASGATSTLTARLADEAGKPIAGQPLQWRSGSKTLATGKTDAAGQAKLTGVARGQKITVTYGGTAKYTSATTTVTS